MGAFEELDTHEPLAAKIERHAYDRLIVLSDGVFAIAATLLALEVKVPPGWDGTVEKLITMESVTAVVSYAVSFMVVGIYWMGNRRILAMFRRVDGVATLLTLVVLMLVALLPPISRILMIEGRFTQSSLFYVGYVTLMGWSQAALWAYGSMAAKLADPSLDLGFKLRSFAWMMITPAAACGMAVGFAQRSGPFGYVAAFLVMAAMMVLRHFVLKHPGAGRGAPTR